ncbi:MAG: hypothetical protein L7S41_02675 [Candidatus Thalassarchaeaceae archaeon]|jgi:hypothetical protein|nr:hypothetical protein [Candidatus Thalassarchaeaceae archaeon]
MDIQYNLITCGCGHSFGSTKMTKNYCTKCGSSTNLKNIQHFDNAGELSSAVSLANIPKEISKELVEKIKQKEMKQKSFSMKKSSDPFNILKKATDENGNLNKNSLDKKLTDEGILEITSEYLIGQAEMQGLLVRVDQNTWNWLS